MTEIDPHHYVIHHVMIPLRRVPAEELMSLAHAAATDMFAPPRHEVAIPAAIQPIKRPPGFDWRAAQAQVPRNGKKQTQWSRRTA